MEMSGQLYAPVALPPGKEEPLYPLDGRLGGPQSRSEGGGEEKNSQPLPGLEPTIIQPIAQRCPGSRRVSLSSVISLLLITLREQHNVWLYEMCLYCCEIWGFHGDEQSDRGLLSYDTVKQCGRIPVFRRTLLPPSSG